jgi:hypothetical protein
MIRSSDVVDAASGLSPDEQEALLEVLRHRIAEQNRARLVSEVAEGRAEHASGRAEKASVQQIMNEARGEP